MNNVDCCNLALSRIGFGTQRQITTLTPPDDTDYAEACARILPTLLALVLEEFPWPFARLCKALAVSTVTVPSGWTYAYAVPADARHVFHVEQDGFIPSWLDLDAQRNRWEVMADPSGSGQIIVSDTVDAWAWYTRDVTELQFASESFGDAVAWRLAAELGLGLKADASLSKNAMAFYNHAVDVALSKALNQRGGQVRVTAESIIARGGQTAAAWPLRA